ncbi:hypothetical protein E8E15_010848 [Penicillium rubens]|nr:hypothetical protein E8E15_010848 [Penicillium rubens]KAJ5045740.1 hypothetical protein NUH16_002560 [Penicillium rubens]
MARAKEYVSILSSEEATTFLAQEIGKKLFMFLLKSPEDLDTSASLSQREWTRCVLELLGMGNLDGLGKHAAEGFLKTLSEEHA